MQNFLNPLTRTAARWMRRTLPLALAVTLSTAPLSAQSLFSPAIRVNSDIVTRYEIAQRQLFFETLRIPGSSEQDVRNSLIDDKLRLQALREAGIDYPPEGVQQGIDEFASRGRLTTEEFLQALAEVGVDAETLRDFVAMQIAWRDYISTRYLAQARPNPDEIDRAMGLGGGGGLQVLLSELIVPVTPQTLDQVDSITRELSQLNSFGAFEAAAAQYSAAETASQGGRLPWIPLADLPPALQPEILSLKPGEVSDPITLPNAIALFQMRDVREAATGTPTYSKIDYAAYYIAGGRSAEGLSAAAELRNRVDVCDDLYGVAKDQPEQVLDRVSAAPGEIPNDIALELAKLDNNEVSTALTRNNGQTLVFLMLCNRTRDLGGDASREEVANALTQQRLQAFADSLIAQLRADAVIVDE
ncbi:peptidylprolyl isomerase [Lutimaribacter marinistellae]|uniref:Parvulin-like PPIase n=1 Tax=Lutimaribacter marinistellae TaxID=1820329 RepID=A0ABV7TN28_9RHOB